MQKIFLGICLSIATFLSFQACQDPASVKPGFYECEFSFNDTSEVHPKAEIYQSIIDKNLPNGIVGASMLVIDDQGLWMGAGGKADLNNEISVRTCNRFLIASISKIFTAATVMKLVDAEKLSLSDPLSDWLSQEVIGEVANANEVNIRQLLNHTSGIPDYYTAAYELDRLDAVYNDHNYLETLEYTFGKNATHPPGETYYYSNTNYLLLGMVIEAVTEQKLEKVYKDLIFNDLGLGSAYYSFLDPIPGRTVKGYVDIYGNGQFVESEFLYKDELVTADGGIAINSFDLAKFMEALYTDRVVSEESFQQMTDWFELPEDWKDDFLGQTKNGLGLEYFETDYGYAVGHTGGVDGFISILHYFPEENATFVYLQNSAAADNEGTRAIISETLEEMFK